MESDALLVKRILAGETEAFRALVEKYQDAVFGVALSKTGSFADVEEIAQETFLAAFESLPTLKDPGSFGNWLYGIARNKVRTHLRAARNRRLAHDRLTEAARHDASSDQHRRDQQRALVRDALRRLSEANREAAALYYINGYSVADIGRFIHRPAGTVKRRLHEARKHLHKELLAMVEGELKQSRPGRKFTERVVSKITQTRVWLSGGRHNYLLWSDAEGRCFQMFVGEHEARAILTSLAEGKEPKGIDIHAALLATLKGFGYRVREVALSPSTAPNHLVRLKLKRGRQRTKTVEAEYTARDAIQLAVHTRADVVLEGDVAKGWLRRKDGKPMSLAGALRSIRRRSARPYRNFEEAIRELEKDPDSDRARRALLEAAKLRTDDPLIQDTRSGMDKLKKWMQRRKGTNLEGLAAGMIGAIHLHPMRQPAKALRYLERAHRSRPEDQYIAFDLATAYTQVGKLQKALELIGRFKFKEARLCNNFKPLWKDPRFRKIAGNPDPLYKTAFKAAQVVTYVISAEQGPGKRRSEFTIKTATAGKALREDLGRWLKGHTVLPVESVRAWFGKDNKDRLLLLEIKGNRAAAIALPPWHDRRVHNLAPALRRARHPWRDRAEGALQALKGCGIDVEAIVLNHKADDEVIADLVSRQGRRRADVPIDALDALCIALKARRPVLIRENLAEKLYVRGKTGRPLTITGAARKLRRANGPNK